MWKWWDGQSLIGIILYGMIVICGVVFLYGILQLHPWVLDVAQREQLLRDVHPAWINHVYGV